MIFTHDILPWKFSLVLLFLRITWPRERGVCLINILNYLLSHQWLTKRHTRISALNYGSYLPGYPESCFLTCFSEGIARWVARIYPGRRNTGKSQTNETMTCPLKKYCNCQYFFLMNNLFSSQKWQSVKGKRAQNLQCTQEQQQNPLLHQLCSKPGKSGQTGRNAAGVMKHLTLAKASVPHQLLCPVWQLYCRIPLGIPNVHKTTPREG